MYNYTCLVRKDCVLDGLVNDVCASILIDTGAATSVLSKDMWDKLGDSDSELSSVSGKVFMGTHYNCMESVSISIQLATEEFPVVGRGC